MFCPECGKEIPAGSNFCLFCGSSLDRVRQFLEETRMTREKGNPHKMGVMTDEKKSQAAAWVKRGDGYVASGDDDDALRCYTAAIGLDPSNYAAWNRKAERLALMGRTMEARICKESIRQLKESPGYASIPEIPPSNPENLGPAETYIGGLSSPSMKLSPSGGKNRDLAGVIGTNVGGYGIYVTDRRIFILKNQKHVFGHPMGPAIGGFLRSELFGGTIDAVRKTIEELEVYKEIEIEKKDLQQICMKKPVLLAGYICFVSNNGEVVMIYVEHQNVYEPVRRLMRKFYPEKIRILK